MQRLLLVDDEPNVLNALRRELAGEFEVETFTSPLLALARCKEASFDLVIADYQMPEMNGIQFLKQLGAIHPDAVRMVLSGQADISALVNAINETHIYRFFAKPWDADELKLSITQALANRRIILENRRLGNDSPTKRRRAAYRILLVDGDEGNLSVMQNGLSQSAYQGLYGAIQKEIIGDDRGGENYELSIDKFSSAAAALAHCERERYDLTIAAQKQRDMDCLEFLRNLKSLQPDCALILIGGDPDQQLLSHAINELHVHSFLNISWETHELKSDAMRRSWNLYQLKAAALHALAARELINSGASGHK